MKRNAFYKVFLMAFCTVICFCVTAYAEAPVIMPYVRSAPPTIFSVPKNAAFNKSGIPAKPKGNKNLFDNDKIRIQDISGAPLGTKYIDGVIHNTINSDEGLSMLEGIKGLKNDDTYVLQYTCKVTDTTPNLVYQDYTSMGARIYFRGVDKMNYVLFSIFKDSALIIVYHDNKILDVPVHVPFNRVDNKAYKVTILSSVNMARVWVDGQLLFTAKDLPIYDYGFGIGVDVNRAIATISDLQLYNVNKDNADANIADVVEKPQTYPGDTLTPITVGNVINRYMTTFVVCGTLGFISIVLAVISLILMIKKRKKST